MVTFLIWDTGIFWPSSIILQQMLWRQACKVFVLRSQRLFFLLVLVFQATWYLLLLVGYVTMPGQLAGADFLTYYSVGRVAREYGLQRVYDLNLAAIAQAETAGVPVGFQQVLPPNHPPFLYPVLAWLAAWPYRWAYLGYALLLYLLTVPAVIFGGNVLRQQGWPPQARWMLLAGIWLFEPFFMSVLKGQDSVFLLLGGILLLGGSLRQDDRLMGVGLSLTLMRPQITLPLALPFLFRRRRVFIWFLVGALFLGAYSLVLVGWQGAQDYLHVLLISAGGEGYGMAEEAMPNLIGFLRRLPSGLEAGLIRGLAWGGYLMMLASLCLLWALSPVLRLWHLALAVCLTLLFVPHVHYHDLTMLLIPLLALSIVRARRSAPDFLVPAWIPTLASLALVMTEFSDLVRFTLPYLLFVLLPWFVWKYEKN